MTDAQVSNLPVEALVAVTGVTARSSAAVIEALVSTIPHVGANLTSAGAFSAVSEEVKITDPRDIPGLICWYSAEGETGYADNDQMTQWTDLSGNGNHAPAAGTTSPRWRSAAGPDGGPAVLFSTSSLIDTNAPQFQPPAAMFSGVTAGEVFITYNPTNSISGIWDMGKDGSLSGAYYPTSGPDWYIEFGSSTRRQILNNVSTYVGSWHRHNFWSTPADWGARIDEVTITTAASNTVEWPAVPIIGRAEEGSSDYALYGHMAAFILFDHKLTDTERNLMDAWLIENPNGGAISPEVTASLTGTGEFTATVEFTPVLEADLTGTGEFTAEATAITSVDAALDGSGTLTAQSSPVMTVTGDLIGTGEHTTVVVAAYTVDAPLSGAGDFSATIEVDTTTSVGAALSGTGEHTATSTEVHITDADLTGTGQHAATVVEVGVVVASLSGSGALTATIAVVQGVVANLTGTGTFTATRSVVGFIRSAVAVFADTDYSKTLTDNGPGRWIVFAPSMETVASAPEVFTVADEPLEPDTTYQWTNNGTFTVT